MIDSGPMGARILFVEDEGETRAFIRSALADGGYELIEASDLLEGWHYARKQAPTLIIADCNLPDGTGLDLIQRVRADGRLSHTPIIMLTARGQLEDKIAGFKTGADHYLVKPIDAAELRLWVEALLRRIDYVEQDAGVLRGDNITLDPQTHKVTIGPDEVKDLTRKEFDLLYELVRRKPKILSKKYILAKLWRAVLRDNTVEVHIRNIRVKLGGHAHRVVTVPGVGYRFD